MRLDDRAARVSEAFSRATGREPEGIWTAPGRANLIGEHTDYNDGLVLPFAIDRQAVAAVALRDDGQLRLWTLQDEPEAWTAYPRGVVRALAAAGAVVNGMELVVDSDVPTGAGLSSSAALECAVALALNDLTAAGLTRLRLAEACQWAENHEVGAQTGIMDQVASLFGVTGAMVLFDVRSREIAQVPAELEEVQLLVIDTRVRHSTAAAGYTERRRECSEAAAAMGITSLRDATVEKVASLAARPGRGGLLGRRARHVLTENARVTRAAAMLRGGRAAELGPLLLASHISLRDDFEVSAPEVNAAVDAAVDAGALGARMVGGGFGGSVLALVPTSSAPAVERRVVRVFRDSGWTEPAVFPVYPAEGAHRIS